jgi:hypothetical protein
LDGQGETGQPRQGVGVRKDCPMDAARAQKLVGALTLFCVHEKLLEF